MEFSLSLKESEVVKVGRGEVTDGAVEDVGWDSSAGSSL